MLDFNYYLVGLDKTEEEFYRYAEGGNLWALDIETSGLDENNDHTKSLTVTKDSKEIWVLPWYTVGQEFIKYLSGKTLVAHNILFERRWLDKYLVDHTWEDTFIMSRIVDSYHPLNKCSLEWCGMRHVSKAAFAAEQEMTTQDKIELPLHVEKMKFYAAMDVFLGAKLFDVYSKKVLSTQQKRVYDMEMAFSVPLQNMEDRGVYFDVDLATYRYEKMLLQAEQYKEELFSAGLESMGPQKIGEFLHDRTKSGTLFYSSNKYNTTDKVLENLDDEYADKILQVRRLRKLASTYYKNPQKSIREDGRLHAKFHQMGAETGRMSSARPNLQNFPVVGRLDQAIAEGLGPRECIKAATGHVLVSTDYSQIEPKVIARHAGDGLFAEVCDIDFYKAFHEDRDTAKRLGLSMLYGSHVESMAKMSGLEVDEVSKIVDGAKAKFPKLFKFGEYVTKYDEELKASYVATPLGRRTYFSSKDKKTKSVNSFAQPAAGDILKESVIKAEGEGLNDGLIMLVHDERIDEVPENDVEEFVYALNKSMEDTSMVPALKVESVVGSNYGELK